MLSLFVCCGYHSVIWLVVAYTDFHHGFEVLKGFIIKFFFLYNSTSTSLFLYQKKTRSFTHTKHSAIIKIIFLNELSQAF